MHTASLSAAEPDKDVLARAEERAQARGSTVRHHAAYSEPGKIRLTELLAAAVCRRDRDWLYRRFGEMVRI